MIKSISSFMQKSKEQEYNFSMINGNEPISIKGVQTWGEMIEALEVQTGIPAQQIQIVVNNEKRYYSRDTNLSDIGLTNYDRLVVLPCPYAFSDPQFASYTNTAKQMQEQCDQEIKKIRNIYRSSEDGVQLKVIIRQNESWRKTFEKLAAQYNQFELMLAIVECKGDQGKIIQYIESSQAKKQFQTKKQLIEQNWLQGIFEQEDQLEINLSLSIEQIQEEYEELIQNMKRKEPLLRYFEPKHRKWIQFTILGITSTSVGDEPSHQQLEILISKMLQLVRQKRKIDKNKFYKNNRLEFNLEDIEKALLQADNCQEKGEQLLNQGLVVSNRKNLFTVIPSKAKVNIVLQMFSHPRLSQIRSSLKGNRKKCKQFVDWVINQIISHDNLKIILKDCKHFVSSYLSGTYQIEEEGDIFNEVTVESEVNLPQSSEQEQQAFKLKIYNQTDLSLVKLLQDNHVDNELAISIARTWKGSQQQLKQYLSLGGVNQSFDFFRPGIQNQQNQLTHFLRKNEAFIAKMSEEKEKEIQLLDLSTKRPGIFELIVRNQAFFKYMVENIQNKIV